MKDWALKVILFIVGVYIFFPSLFSRASRDLGRSSRRMRVRGARYMERRRGERYLRYEQDRKNGKLSRWGANYQRRYVAKAVYRKNRYGS